MRIAAVEASGSRLNAAPIHIHVAGVTLNSQDDPTPLIVVTDLPTADDSRFAVSPLLAISVVVIEIFVLTVTKLASDVETDIKTGTIARRTRRRRNLRQ